MKAVYVQPGKNLDYKNETGSLIEAGSVVQIGNRIGIAGTTIPVGELGSIVMEGIYKLPKKESEVVTLGAELAYEESGMTAATEQKKAVGYAVAAAKAEDSAVLVKLLG